MGLGVGSCHGVAKGIEGGEVTNRAARGSFIPVLKLEVSPPHPPPPDREIVHVQLFKVVRKCTHAVTYCQGSCTSSVG